MTVFLLLSLERLGGSGACWWLPSQHGYTRSVADAGRFNWQEVAEIIGDGRLDGDIPVPVESVDAVVALIAAGRTVRYALTPAMADAALRVVEKYGSERCGICSEPIEACACVRQGRR